MSKPRFQITPVIASALMQIEAVRRDLRRAGYGIWGIYSLDKHHATNLVAYYDVISIGHHNHYEDRADAEVTSFVSYLCQGMDVAFSKIRAVAQKTVTEAANPSADSCANLIPACGSSWHFLHNGGRPPARRSPMALRHGGLSPKTWKKSWAMVCHSCETRRSNTNSSDDRCPGLHSADRLCT